MATAGTVLTERFLASQFAPGTIEQLIEGAIDAGLVDLADAAIQALDAATHDPDLETEEDGDGFVQSLPMVCACCAGLGRFDPEHIA